MNKVTVASHKLYISLYPLCVSLQDRLHGWYTYLQEMYATSVKIIHNNARFTISFVGGLVCGLIFF